MLQVLTQVRDAGMRALMISSFDFGPALELTPLTKLWASVYYHDPVPALQAGEMQSRETYIR
jgi:hypothetical protein